MHRRSFCVTAAAAIALPLAGCSEPTGGSLSMEPLGGDTEIGTRYAGSTDALSSDRRALVEAAIAGETPTRERRRPTYEASRPLEHEGAIYEISHEAIDERTATRYSIRIDYDPERPPSSVIAYADLPAIDRRALEGQIPPEEDPPTGEGFDLDVTHRYDDEAGSVLVPEPQYEGISYEGSTYRIGIGVNREVTVRTYEYDAARIADSAGELGAQLRERYLFVLSGLSRGERDIVEEAKRIYHPEGDGVPDAFRSLVDRFRGRDGIDVDEDGGTWLAEYDGTAYWVHLEFPPEAERR